MLLLLQTPLAELKVPLQLKWRRGKDMPIQMYGYPRVVMVKEKVYIGGGMTSPDRDGLTVMVYEPMQDSWDTLHPYTYRSFSMAIVDDQLVLVGGYEVGRYHNKTNKLGVWNEQSKRWTRPLPPMTTACSSPSVATHNKRWLVVMGGNGIGGDLSRVEILDTAEPVQWYQAASLPQPCQQVSLATIGNMCYLLGGFTNDASEKVFSVYLDDLISYKATSQPTSANVPPIPVPSPWQSLPDTPMTHSTALAFNGALLAIGGGSSGSSAIHMYQPSSNSWVVAGELPTPRGHSGCIVLPTGELLIAGGGAHVYGDETHQMIEIASIL